MKAICMILAAGEGKRMKSDKPKVAHELLGKPLVRWVVDASHEAGCEDVICVLGYKREQVMPLVTDALVVVQEQQLGTAHAVSCARELLAGRDGSLVVLSGDSPLIRAATIEQLVACKESLGAAAVVLTMIPPDATGYGRIVRDELGALQGIVEDKDCTSEQRALEECNSGIYCFDTQQLLDCLDAITATNAQGEFYLTDAIGILRERGHIVAALLADDYTEALGVNSLEQLEAAAAIMQARDAEPRV